MNKAQCFPPLIHWGSTAPPRHRAGLLPPWKEPSDFFFLVSLDETSPTASHSSALQL